MSGFLVISSFDISDQLEDVERETNSKRLFDLREKQDILCLNNRKINVILNKMGRRHSIVNIDGVNFVQIKIEKPIRDNY